VSTRVYVVARGERGEGNSPEAVFTTLAVARRWAEMTYGPLTRLIDDGPGHWMWALANGVDQVAISRHPIRRSLT